MINCKNFISTLKRQHFAPVPLPIKRTDLESAMDSFLKFLEEPDAIKNHIQFSISEKHRRGDVGYTHRDPKKGRSYTDSKDFFHYHPAIWDQHRDFVNDNPVLLNFMKKAQPIWDCVYQTMDEILSEFETKFPGSKSKIFDTKYPHILLRFLRYSWNDPGKYLAKPHFDAGAFTLALAESDPGLRIGSCPDDLELVNHQDGQGIFMFSSNYKKVIDTDDIKPGWHDVIQLDESSIGKPFSRWAIVAFIEAHNVEALSRDETHKYYKEG